ncbi:MAG: HTH domain-containing protein [Thermoplasmatales archaeon]|nr:MAG: HTH domain-containing protein [Thermoplasmatales archaeon]
MPAINPGKDKKQKVLDAIKKADPPYVTIQDMADKTGFSRETVSKYMAVLEAEGKIKITKTIGKANLFEAEK